MESQWAVENLQVIRTLMERSALYRRALAPVMLLNGVLGVIAGGIGYYLHMGSLRSFALFWAAVAIVALAGSFALVRKQALRDKETFWTPPTRRVTLAMVPPLATGGLLGALCFASSSQFNPALHARLMMILPAAWIILYGCAFHAAGFFMPRGLRLFGWLAMILGLLFIAWTLWTDSRGEGSAIMGIYFGGVHLAYGVYLYFTEPRGNET